jgi:hypothetical protein
VLKQGMMGSECLVRGIHFASSIMNLSFLSILGMSMAENDIIMIIKVLSTYVRCDELGDYTSVMLSRSLASA